MCVCLFCKATCCRTSSSTWAVVERALSSTTPFQQVEELNVPLLTLIISRNRQVTDFSLTEAETVARTRGLDPGDWTPDLCSPWKSVWPLFGAAPSLGLTWFRCGVAFAGPALWASSGSRGRSGSRRKAPGASPVSPASCPQLPSPLSCCTGCHVPLRSGNSSLSCPLAGAAAGE